MLSSNYDNEERERLRLRRLRQQVRPAPLPWRTWLAQHFPAYVAAPFAPRHEALWGWLEALEPGVRPRPKVDIWPRGGGKSTSAELGCARVGATQRRRFALYVSKTQDAADRHVQSIAALFERLGIDRALNRYGTSKGWSRQMLRAANGFNVLAIGLDAGVRGVKLDDLRPDLIILDDVDDRHDTPATVAKKRETITESILPSGSTDCAILFIQNRIHDASMAAQLADGTADWLLDRLPSIEEPAVIDLAYEQRAREDGTLYYAVTGGTPTWEGQSLAICEQQINAWGRRAFEREAQHLTRRTGNGLWNEARDLAPHRVTEAPELVRIVVAVDPNASSGNDEAGIVVDGLGVDGHAYLLADRTVAGGPAIWAREAVAAYHTFNADALLAEANNGGDMVAITIGTIPNAPPVTLLHASRGKLTRAEPIQMLYEQGMVHHVGVFALLEDELCSWRPGMPSPNRLDAQVWALTDLLLQTMTGDL
jgi:hypothetical protein